MNSLNIEDMIKKIYTNLLNANQENVTPSNNNDCDQNLIRARKLLLPATLNDLEITINNGQIQEYQTLNDDKFLDEILLNYEHELYSSACSPPITYNSVDPDDADTNIDISFLRIIIWMKAMIKMSRKVSLNNVEEIYNNFMVIYRDQSLLQCIPSRQQSISDININNTEIELNQTELVNETIIDENNVDIQQLKKRKKINSLKTHSVNLRNNHDSAIGESLIMDTQTVIDGPDTEESVLPKKLRLPDIDVEASQISNAICFSDCESSSPFAGLKSPEKLSQQKQKKTKTLEKIISPNYVELILSKCYTDNFVFGIIKNLMKILGNITEPKCLHYEAVGTIVEFINIISSEIKINSCAVSKSLISGTLTNFYINIIFSLIKKTFNLSEIEYFTDISSKEEQITLILEFCNCKKICLKTIDFLIDELSALTDATCTQPSPNDNLTNNFHLYKTKEQILVDALEIILKKYCVLCKCEQINSTVALNAIVQLQKQYRTFMPKVTNEKEKNFYNKDCSLMWTHSLTNIVLKKLDLHPHIDIENIYKLIQILNN